MIQALIASAQRPNPAPRVFATLLLCSALVVPLTTAFAQGTAFTYQGSLMSDGMPVTGEQDFVFLLFDSALGSDGGPFVEENDLGVTNGLFTVSLDFDAAAFSGGERWIEIWVRPGDSIGIFTKLSPRQPVTPVPYAMLSAESSSLVGPLPSASLSGTYGNALALTNAANQFFGTFRGKAENLTNFSLFGSATFAGSTVGFSSASTHFYSPTYFHEDLTLDFASILGRTGYAELGSLRVFDQLFFADWFGQFINLRGPEYGIGIQNETLYQRAAGSPVSAGFAWYKGGVHSNTARDPGTGGKRLMTLDDNGLVVTPPAGAAGLTVAGYRTGSFGTPVVTIQNLHLTSSPALRLLGGSSDYGVLSVSVVGNGLIAQFGNDTEFVSRLTRSGQWYATGFSSTSDRNAKQDFEPVDTQAVLDKVVALPITRWSFKQEPATRHVGPVAQDFFAAFELGTDDKHIATVDADGVALAAIQGLNEKVETADQRAEARIRTLEIENAELKRRLDALEERVHSSLRTQ